MKAAFDIEADGLLDELTQIWCAVVIDEQGVEKQFTPETIDQLPAYLEQYEELLGHNCIGYDFPALRKVFNWEYTGIKTDTLLRSRMQRPNRPAPKNMRGTAGPHSVEAWGYRIGVPKVANEDWSQFTPNMLERCLQDTRALWKIYHALEEEGKDEGWEKAHKLTAKLHHYLQKQEEYGWYVDKDHLIKSIDYLDRAMARITRVIEPKLPLILEINETKKEGDYSYLKKPFKKDGSPSEAALKTNIDNIGGPFSRISWRKVNIDSTIEIKRFLLEQGWEPLEWNTNNVGEITSPKLSKDDKFDGIQGSLGRLVAKRVIIKQRKSILEGWLESIRPDGRISAGVAGMASTGRLRHRGIVNVPSPETKSYFAKQMRAVFSTRPGWVLVGTDSKSNQMRQLAGRLMSAFPPEGDKEFNYAVLNGTKEEGTDLHSLNQRRSGVDTRTKAKNFFYGCILFGAGDKKTAKVIGGTTEQAKALKAGYFNQMPMLRDFLEQERVKWRATAQKWWNSQFNRMEYKNGFITGLDGRPISVEFEKDILVYYLQGDEAVHMSVAYCWLNKQLERRWTWAEDYGFCIWYHDEFQVECRPEIKEEVAALSRESIAWAGRFLNIPIPHEGDSSIGANWSETH